MVCPRGGSTTKGGGGRAVNPDNISMVGSALMLPFAVVLSFLPATRPKHLLVSFALLGYDRREHFEQGWLGLGALSITPGDPTIQGNVNHAKSAQAASEKAADTAFEDPGPVGCGEAQCPSRVIN